MEDYIFPTPLKDSPDTLKEKKKENKMLMNPKPIEIESLELILTNTWLH